ncbi:hypothetical protein LNV09_03675 [Paucibacter sp. B2R-40]|uniref:hypothetical protein n=1 Tax=Paucibacter sp. B2R-40 TaxID=2893554 RepID=UPI0021E3BE9A|nr:hypothetical protein [Paucibacter sp. B2R-40]MCV2353256.1 hypothetical protein [Paucibacter sp. B2R-40]
MHALTPKQNTRASRALLAFVGLAFASAALALTPISDDELARVQGRDGFAFNLRGFALQGPLTLRLGAADGSGLALSNFALSRSDDLAATFSDPYQLSLIKAPAVGMPDRVVLSEPLNLNGALSWQFAADLSLIDKNNSAAPNFNAGALLLQDLRSYGGSLSLAPSADPNEQGIAFGLGLRLDVGALLLRPRGRADTALFDSPGAAEQFSLRGIHLAAATADGQLGSSLWRIADLDRQPLLLNAISSPESGGFLHLNLAWPSQGQAPTGSLLIDNIAFKSDVGPSLDLGSSRIGSMQIQYLDIRLKTGP